MPGLERGTDILETSKRNSSQINCTLDFGFPAAPSNVDGIVTNSDMGNLNTSTSVVTSQDTNKGILRQFYGKYHNCLLKKNYIII